MQLPLPAFSSSTSNLGGVRVSHTPQFTEHAGHFRQKPGDCAVGAASRSEKPVPISVSKDERRGIVTTNEC